MGSSRVPSGIRTLSRSLCKTSGQVLFQQAAKAHDQPVIIQTGHGISKLQLYMGGGSIIRTGYNQYYHSKRIHRKNSGIALNRRTYGQNSDGRSILEKIFGKNSYFLKLSYLGQFWTFWALVCCKHHEFIIQLEYGIKSKTVFQIWILFGYYYIF